jgi:phage baseplate assembly protein W
MAFASATHPISKELTFSDVNVSFTPHPVTGKLPVLKNADAVKRALRNLILTNKYERPYQPNFGGNLISQLFELSTLNALSTVNAGLSTVENASAIDRFAIRNQIETTINNYEKRAKVTDIQTEFDEQTNRLNVTIRFQIVNQRLPVDLTISIQRVR